MLKKLTKAISLVVLAYLTTAPAQASSGLAFEQQVGPGNFSSPKGPFQVKLHCDNLVDCKQTALITQSSGKTSVDEKKIHQIEKGVEDFAGLERALKYSYDHLSERPRKSDFLAIQDNMRDFFAKGPVKLSFCNTLVSSNDQREAYCYLEDGPHSDANTIVYFVPLMSRCDNGDGVCAYAPIPLYKD